MYTHLERNPSTGDGTKLNPRSNKEDDGGEFDGSQGAR
jgi:hypothetical protein